VPKIPFALSAIFQHWGALSAIFSIFFQKKLAIIHGPATIYIKQGKQEKTSRAEKVKNL
jgi:hypothetical protein